MTPEQKLKALLQKASELTGQVIPEPVLPERLETSDDRMREAQAVINFFTLDVAWEVEYCRTCQQQFAYHWHYKGVKYCSIHCAAAALRRLGLEWDPEREPERRWGSSAPGVVPPSVLKILQQLQIETQAIPLDSIIPESLEQTQLALFDVVD